MPTLNVVDISKWQNPDQLDWQGLKNAGVKAVIVQLSHGKSEEQYAAQHVAKARQYGLKVAGYHFYEATSGEVQVSVNIAKKYLSSGDFMFLDMEGSIGGDWQSQFYDFRNEWIKQGWKAGVYLSDSPYKAKFNNAKLVNDGVYRWIASYSYEPANYDIWQYSSTGGVGSYKSNLDHDYDKTGQLINGPAAQPTQPTSGTQPTQPTQPTTPVIPPDDITQIYQDISFQYGKDTESGIYGYGWSSDNGVTFHVINTTWGRKFYQQDADRIAPFLKNVSFSHIKLKSPNGTAFLVSVDDDGNLKATKAGDKSE